MAILMGDEEPRKRVSTRRCWMCLKNKEDSFLNFEKWGSGTIRWSCVKCGFIELIEHSDGHGGRL